MSDLARAVADVAALLGPVHVRSLASAYESEASFSPGAAVRTKQALPAPHQVQVEPINATWAGDPTVPGSAIGLALRACLATDSSDDELAVQVVVTGPSSIKAPVRLTSEVVKELIGSAKDRVTIVSFAAYYMATLIDALDAAVQRGVTVRVILESPENLDGGGGGDAYSKFQAYRWPTEHRPPGAKLHAKAVIVDGRDVLLTSANMTNNAYDRNIELGVLCRGGDVARCAQAHFDGLVAAGVLVRV